MLCLFRFSRPNLITLDTLDKQFPINKTLLLKVTHNDVALSLLYHSSVLDG